MAHGGGLGRTLVLSFVVCFFVHSSFAIILMGKRELIALLLAKTRSDRDKLFHFWSKMKSHESQNKHFLFLASYLVHLILEGFVAVLFITKLQHLK